MKFLVILVSLLMIIFGGLFSYITYDKKCIGDIKKKVKKEILLTNTDNIKLNKIINDISTYGFLVFIFGICLFIAGLFI